MHTKETCIQRYKDMKALAGGMAPKYRDFLDQVGLSNTRLMELFGSEAYTKLQQEAGDVPNRLKIERTQTRTIMERYAALVVETGVVPVYAEWAQRGLRPTSSGLDESHGIKWSKMPQRLLEWVASKAEGEFETAVAIVKGALAVKGDNALSPPPSDRGLTRLLGDIRRWMPARRRNSEGEYKIELRKHLESLGYRLNEEHGDSLCDLLVDRAFSIEIKKDPSLQEYGRLFGQIARHLQGYSSVIVLIFDPRRGDTHDKFLSLVDRFLNVGQSSVEVVCK